MSELRVRESGDFGRYHVQSENKPEDFYLVQLFEMGDRCSCSHHRFRGAHCKHIKAAEKVWQTKCMKFGEAYSRNKNPEDLGQLFRWLVTQKQLKKDEDK